MKEAEILSGLEKIVESLDIQLRYEKGDFAGGHCVVENQHMLFVPSALPAAQRVKVLARELAQMNVESVFIVPALRAVIDEARQALSMPAQTTLVENIDSKLTLHPDPYGQN
ncbi:MAG: hypothetical protein ACREOO_30295 [bacterium]